jgi:hypothetical protein
MAAGARRQFAGAGPLIHYYVRGLIRFGKYLIYVALENFYSVPDDLATHAIVAKVETVQLPFSARMPCGTCFIGPTPHHIRKPWDKTPCSIVPDSYDTFKPLT